VRCRLIFPPSLAAHGLLEANMPKKLNTFGPGRLPVDWEGCEYSKCGRTDRGVSAFGQVVGLKVRSAVTAEKDEVKDELHYVAMLNRVLPDTIRILAWCPRPPETFDARFSCKEREYRYFFTSPAYLSVPGSSKQSGKLDIEAMREAASYLVGSHDFRNFCKIDGSKQITEFHRRVDHASVDFVSPLTQPNLFAPQAGEFDHSGLFAFRIRGSAFLWHQVRCMVAILFLVGQGLEKPTIIKDLVNIELCSSRPQYEMATDKPLVLWDCKFSTTAGKLNEDSVIDRPLWDRGSGDDELEWVYAGTSMSATPESKWASSGIMEHLWKNWRNAKIDEILASQLMDLVADTKLVVGDPVPTESENSVRIFQGDYTAVAKGRYIPIMQKPRMDAAEVVNARWATKKRSRESE